MSSFEPGKPDKSLEELFADLYGAGTQKNGLGSALGHHAAIIAKVTRENTRAVDALGVKIQQLNDAGAKLQKVAITLTIVAVVLAFLQVWFAWRSTLYSSQAPATSAQSSPPSSSPILK